MGDDAPLAEFAFAEKAGELKEPLNWEDPFGGSLPAGSLLSIKWTWPKEQKAKLAYGGGNPKREIAAMFGGGRVDVRAMDPRHNPKTRRAENQFFARKIFWIPCPPDGPYPPLHEEEEDDDDMERTMPVQPPARAAASSPAARPPMVQTVSEAVASGGHEPMLLHVVGQLSEQVRVLQERSTRGPRFPSTR